MKRLALLGTLTMLLGCVAAPTTTAPQTVARTAPSPPTPPIGADTTRVDPTGRAVTVRIDTTMCGGRASGSGILVDGPQVVTNRHVVDDALTVRVRTVGGTDLQVGEVAVYELIDVAVIQVDGVPPDAWPVALGEDPEPGAPVLAAGFPRGGPFALSSGEVRDDFVDARYGTLGRVVRFTAAVDHGSSGGPLLSADGHLVGIVYAGEIDSGLSLALPVSTVDRALRRLYEGAPPQPAC